MLCRDPYGAHKMCFFHSSVQPSFLWVAAVGSPILQAEFNVPRNEPSVKRSASLNELHCRTVLDGERVDLCLPRVARSSTKLSSDHRRQPSRPHSMDEVTWHVLPIARPHRCWRVPKQIVRLAGGGNQLFTFPGRFSSVNQLSRVDQHRRKELLQVEPSSLSVVYLVLCQGWTRYLVRPGRVAVACATVGQAPEETVV